MHRSASQPSYNPSGNAAIMSDEVPEYLRFLFIAEFDDNSQLAQTHEDVSEIQEGKSAFYDVLYHTGQLEDHQPEQVKKIIRFHLTDKHNWWTVDLRDGLFECNGLPFSTLPQNISPNPPLTLIYFRETRADKYSDGTEIQYVNQYYLGWWCLDSNGQKIEQTIAIR